MQNTSNSLLLGATEKGDQCFLLPSMANRHGIITGATGTGKTVTLQLLAEGFSRLGVPVFTADVKGDLSGLAMSGTASEKLLARAKKVGLEQIAPQASPVLFWDTVGKTGHHVRSTISELGPLLLTSLLELNDTQEGIIHATFALADDEGMLLLDLKDLRSLLNWMGENSKELQLKYGNMTAASIAAIQRRLMVLEEAGGETFFAEPALQIKHLMQKDFSGNGVISILDATSLIGNPRIYATFLLWLLSELFETLDEVGDQELPRMIFFFDEAHLLFDQAPKALLQKIENVSRLIRSKGVGIYFVTQNPSDIPSEIMTQMGNRIQHALRGYTPKDRQALKAAADTFRPNPEFSTIDVISNLGVGEALVSVLDAQGTPTIVQRVLVAPPCSRIGPITTEERQACLSRSPLSGVYDTEIDRESAYEVLEKRRTTAAEADRKELEQKQEDAASSKKSNRQGFGETFFKSLLRTVGRQIGRQITRGILGSIRGGRR